MSLWKKIFGSVEKETPKPDKPEDKPAVDYEKLRSQIMSTRRIAYLPVINEVEYSHSIRSKFGGYPYLRNENDWPRCPHCNNHMQLFAQINLNEIPIKKSEGLIQLFYCTNFDKECDIVNEGYSPFSKNTVCRKIDIDRASAAVTPEITELFPEKVIVSWEPKDDYPGYEELGELGIDLAAYGDDIMDWLEEQHFEPASGDKLFGWPFWVQSIEYPNDRRTNEQMELFLQIDSEINVPYMFGDSGIGHLTQSPDNPDELAFGWACY